MNIRLLTLTAALVLSMGASALADCPSQAQDDPYVKITIERGRILAFPVAGDQMAQQGVMWACVYDQETGKPVSDLSFDLIRYEGKVHGRGPEIDDLEFFNPARGTLKTAGDPNRIKSSAAGKILGKHLTPGQYALVPNWDSIAADSLEVDFVSASTLLVDVSYASLLSTSASGR